MAAVSFDRIFAFRTDLASRAAALAFVSNVSLMVLKVAVGVATGSIAVLSDGIDSAQDAIASTFAFLSIRVAARPADAEHPYGHGKAESVAAAAQGLLIAGGAVYIIVAAVLRLIDHHVAINTGPGFVALAVTAVVNVAVVMYVGRAARATGSVALKADTRHLWTNVAQAIAVIVALALVAITGHSFFDPIMALGLAAYLIWTAGHVLVAAMGEIMDVRLSAPEERIVEACLRDLRANGVRGYHHLRTRKAGRQRYIDFHLLVDSQQSVAAAHDLCDALETELCERIPGAVVSIHIEPDDGRFRSALEDEDGALMGHPERE